jgi:hypothetical protein
MTAEIPWRTVAQFGADHLRSIDDLHVLVTCAHGCGRWWDGATLGRELQMSANVAHEVLEHLAQRNLLDVRVTGEVRYRFRPGNQRLSEAARQFLEAFSRQPFEVTKLAASGGRTGSWRFSS